jgi:hypothetical protein
MFVLVVSLDRGSAGVAFAGRLEQRVCQGESDQAGYGEDEEGEELGLET